VPITLADLSVEMAEFFGVSGERGDEALIHDNVVEGNHIVGAEGLGIELLRASRNRIVDNTVSEISVRDPFPGNTMYVPPGWHEANGAGIWVSPGSNENEIVGNTFEDIASDALVIEGARNRVQTRSARDVVRDMGSGNRVTGRDGSAHPDAEHREGSQQDGIGLLHGPRHSEPHLAGAFAIGEDHEGVPGAGQRRPPAQSGRAARCRSQLVHASREGLCQRAIMMRQLVRTQLQRGQHLRIGAVRDAIHQCARERHLDERERVPDLSQVRRTEGSAAEGSEHLADGMLRRLREVANRRAVLKIEAAHRLARDQV
jgi:parallel beta-helix repeat protein